jgi:hypothetical protein
MMYTRSGLGGSPLTSQIISTGGAAAGVTAGALIGTAVFPGFGTAVGAAIGLVSGLIGSLFSGGVTGQEKVASTNIVNQVEPLLKQNLAAYMAGPRTPANQAAALANFDQAWAGVEQACSNPSLGAPGQACISDRQAGGKWDWFSYYRDPIANDPTVSSGGGNVPAAATSLFSGSSLIPLLIAGAILLAVAD